MSRPDERGAVSIAVESLVMPLSAVRLERRTDAPPQALSIRLEKGTLVVTCGLTAFIETAETGPHAGRLILRDGPLAIQVDRTSISALDPDRGTPRSHAAAGLPRLLSGPARLEVEEAEWQEVTPTDCTRIDMPSEIDARRSASAASAVRAALSRHAASQPAPTRPESAGDAPTRIQILDGEMEFEEMRVAVPPPRPRPPPPPPVASSPSRAVAPAPPVIAPRIRPSVRRFALIAMFAASFLLWLHAYRARHGQTSSKAHGASTHASSAASGASTIGSGVLPPPTSSDSHGASAPASASTSAPRLASAEPASPPRRSGVSRERAAADALANGAYADALTLYEELAAEPDGNPAFAHVAQSLRARTSERAP